MYIYVPTLGAAITPVSLFSGGGYKIKVVSAADLPRDHFYRWRERGSCHDPVPFASYWSCRQRRRQSHPFPSCAWRRKNFEKDLVRIWRKAGLRKAPPGWVTPNIFIKNL
ncbi:hypothetical protein AB205_0157710 [Aquarana catesbeiana]|uniref:Uncharacterized protein n=1 Tax=Aquarana catesbeiana TaxID=8400 RepID=A0A2G9RQ48_AQUCT|nr:hypothetical protein AB205_0157710 [Aquarana catesbeiana]